MAAERVMPSGPERDDYRMGAALELIAAALSKKGSKKMRWWDWFPEHDPEKGRERQTPHEVFRRFEAFARKAGLIPKEGA